MTSTGTRSRTLADLVEAAEGRVVCLAMSKDPNAKLTVLLFGPSGDVPVLVAKVPTTDRAALAVQAETAVLCRLRELELGPLGATVPEVVCVADDGGRPVLVTTALPGRQMLASYHTWRHTARPALVASDFDAAGRWLADLHRGTATGWCDLAGMLDGVGDTLQRRFGADSRTVDDLARLTELSDRLSGHAVPRVAVHGDFWPGNLLITDGRVSGVIDWESAQLAGVAVRDLTRFAVTYSLYLDRHTRSGRRVPGHASLRAGPWGAGLDYGVAGQGWYPELVKGFVAAGLDRLGVPAACTRDVLLAEIACIAAEADHDDFARNHLLAFRRLAGGPR